MKLRVRINKQTSRVDLPGEDPSLKELTDHIRAHVLSSHGLSSDADFGLSLNGRERLCDSGQVLSSCGIVPGDLVFVILPGPDATDFDLHQNPAERLCDQFVHLKLGQQQKDPEEEVSLTSPPLAPCWEPLLCCEAANGQAPLSLEILYHGAQVTSPSDAAMVAAHLLMLETGFTPQGCELKPDEMPAGWRSGESTYKLQYLHPLCENILVTLVAMDTGPMLLIDAILKVKGSVSSVCTLSLSPCSYVTDEWPGESAAAAFKDLSKLSRVFKDQLAYPLIAEARADSVACWEPLLCCEAACGQAPLSLEILYHKARVMSPSDAIMVAAHLLMLETGFTPQGCELKPDEMPVGWRSAEGTYKLQYAHPLCDSILVMLAAVDTGPVLIVDATLKVKGSVSSVCKLTLSPCSYVTDEWPGESAAAAFKDLSKLSRVFKDQLAYPLIAEARAGEDAAAV